MAEEQPGQQAEFPVRHGYRHRTEYFVNSREAELAAKNGKMPVSNLSKFEKGWMKAFKDVKRTTIVEEVDAWYAAHPDRLDRPVLGVLWFELVEPRLAAAQ